MSLRKRSLLYSNTMKTKENRVSTASAARPGIYIHIPFCVRKCFYCDFVSYSGCSQEAQKKYFESLDREIAFKFPGTEKHKFRNGGKPSEAEKRIPAQAPPAKTAYQPLCADSAADTLFVGGGTPTSVDPRYIAELVSRLPLTNDAELTIESNPGTLTPEKLDIYRGAGFNRLSIGVQSFDDGELRLLGRIHDAAEAEKTIEMAREHGFDNINLDFMFGFPGQTLDSWKRTLDKALSFRPEHISFYSLQIEEGTPFYDMFRSGELEQIPDELNRDMYHAAVSMLLEHGYVHYEISNASLPGRECRHNLKYWSMIPYIGLGAGAHSFDGSTRMSNPAGIDEYCRLTESCSYHTGMHCRYSGSLSIESKDEAFREESENSGCQDGSGYSFERETTDDLISDFMFTGLRLVRGVSDRYFRKLFGISLEERFGEQISKYTSEGLMTFENGRLAFTGRGLDIANSILIDFI